MFVIVFLEYGETKSTESAEAEENVSVLLSEWMNEWIHMVPINSAWPSLHG